MTLMAAWSTATPDTHYTEEAVENHPDVEMGELQQKGIVDQLSATLSLLAFTSGPDTVEPGSTHEFAPEVTLTETIDVEGKVKIIEFYRCADSSCDNPDQDEFIEAARDHIEWSGTEDEGTDWWWSVDYTVPSEKGYYEAAAYIYDPDSASLVSTTETHQFEVRSEDSTTEGSDINVELIECAEPEVRETSTNIEAEFCIENVGDSMYELASDGVDNDNDGKVDEKDEREYLVEFQLRDNRLSFVGSQQTCDDLVDTNQHRKFTLSSGEKANINIKISKQYLEEGNTYWAYGMTRSECANAEGNQERVGPYPTSTGSLAAIDVESGDNRKLIEITEKSDLPVTAIGFGLVIAALVGLVVIRVG